MKALERMRAIGELIGLSSTEKAVLWALALRANNDGACWPSHETIAKSAGLTRRGAIKAIQSLVGKRLLAANVRRTDQGRRTSNVYVLNLAPDSAPAVNDVHPSESSSSEPCSPLSSERRSPLGAVEGCTTFTPVCEPRSPPEGEPRSHDLIREELITGNEERARADAHGVSLPLGELPALKLQRPSAKSARPPKTSNEVTAIFDAWADARKARHPKGRPILDVKRSKFIAARLVDGFDVETLKLAAAGIWLDPFSLGENDRRQEYTDIAIALRDAAHVEKFAELARAKSTVATPVREPLVRERQLSPEDRAESQRILREGFMALDAKLENDRQIFEGGSLEARR